MSYGKGDVTIWHPSFDSDPRVRQDYPSLGLLPVFDDTTGNCIGLQLAPGPAGTFGQVVVFGADYDGAQCVCAGLEELFERLTGDVRAGRLQVTVRPGLPPEGRLRGVTGILMDFLS